MKLFEAAHKEGSDRDIVHLGNQSRDNTFRKLYCYNIWDDR